LNFLRSVHDAMFWKSNFDYQYKGYADSVSYMIDDLIGEGVDKMLQEKRLLFRETRPYAGSPSSELALIAFVDFCDEYRVRSSNWIASFPRRNTLDLDLKVDLMHLSNVIALAGYDDRYGNFIFYPSTLQSFFVRPHWSELHAEFSALREIAESRKTLMTKISHEKASLVQACEELEEGILISDGGHKVWEAITHRVTAWEISSMSNIGLDEAVFWLRVLRSVGIVKSYWNNSPIGPYYSRISSLDLPESKDVILDALR